MALANVLAVSQAAKTVVLIGDPQQLDQPMQGSHPEGTDASALDHILGGARTMISLATLDERRECQVHRVTKPDHLLPSAGSPTNAPPLRIAARYAAGRPRPNHSGGPIFRE